MEYKRIKSKKIYEQVADSLIDMIKQGRIQPGDKLDSVEQLAQNFGVGRSAIREALSGLRSMGLVEMRQGEGTFINTFNPKRFTLPVSTAFLMKQDDVKELYQVRKILEGGTARYAATSYEQADLEKMEKTLNIMKNAKGDDVLAEQADTEFHLAIAQATHMDLLIHLMGSVSDLMSETIRETRQILLYSEDRADALYDEHDRIYQAIKNRQPNEARDAMYDHLEKVEMLLFKNLDM
ncbi:FadR/GntR family transcriptional regulator [Oceanobacillus iheyensis]|uniref:Transcriptional regulator (GntR family) n=1 Tax=Oceanobacillus iheyensis (strain DSM 14371 / CIP 107618 / JCM 11309 / KCTC 3954 / HTE831) TaxID=221109 RepID=Q8ET93_OCEIH|nr:FadR/GntR family transcriptional regulator [Oceanobacillus iheyensis]BAC12325.1 transcriptional regulator (GntR family) [Oceanobacillus iheyensis HTE831]